MMNSSNLQEQLEYTHDTIDTVKGFSYGTIIDTLAHNRLLKKSRLIDALAGDRITLLHQTHAGDRINESSILHPGYGCLGPVVYTVPYYGNTKGDCEIDNFINVVLSHQSAGDGGHMSEVVIVLNKLAPDEIRGFNYLRAGKMIREVATQILEPAVIQEVTNRVRRTISLTTYNELLRNDDVEKSLDAMASLARSLPFFAQLYYEALSQVLMMSSTDETTMILAEQGQWNAHCYYDPLFYYHTQLDGRYNSSLFTPSYRQLVNLLEEMNSQGVIKVDPVRTSLSVVTNIRQIIASLGRRANFIEHVIGQQLMSEYPQLVAPCLDEVLQKFRTQNNIRLVVNTATFKPEIGVVGNGDAQYTVDSVVKQLQIKARSGSL